jgi:hypothetical protein
MTESFLRTEKQIFDKLLKHLRPVLDLPMVNYASPNSVNITAGGVWDETGKVFMQVSAQTLTLPGSLDTGTESANTWYYPWIIGRADGTTRVLLSSSHTSVNYPFGFIYRKRLKIGLRNDNNSNFIPFDIIAGYPDRPVIKYRDLTSDYRILTGIADTPTLVTTVVPPASSIAILTFNVNAANSVFNQALYRTPGLNWKGVGVPYPLAGVVHTLTDEVALNASKQFEYVVGNSATVFEAYMQGYIWTE